MSTDEVRSSVEQFIPYIGTVFPGAVPATPEGAQNLLSRVGPDLAHANQSGLGRMNTVVMVRTAHIILRYPSIKDFRAFFCPIYVGSGIYE